METKKLIKKAVKFSELNDKEEITKLESFLNAYFAVKQYDSEAAKNIVAPAFRMTSVELSVLVLGTGYIEITKKDGDILYSMSF